MKKVCLYRILCMKFSLSLHFFSVMIRMLLFFLSFFFSIFLLTETDLRMLLFFWYYRVQYRLCLTLVTPWTVACQALLSMGFPRQDCWSGLPFLLPRDLPDPGIKSTFPVSLALQVDSLSVEPSRKHQGGIFPHKNFHIRIPSPVLRKERKIFYCPATKHYGPLQPIRNHCNFELSHL